MLPLADVVFFRRCAYFLLISLLLLFFFLSRSSLSMLAFILFADDFMLDAFRLSLFIIFDFRCCLR